MAPVRLITMLTASTGMSIELELSGTGAAACVLVDSADADDAAAAAIAPGTHAVQVTFTDALTLDGPYMYCSTLSTSVTIAATASDKQGNDVTDFAPVTLTVYSEPGAPVITR